MGKKLKVSEPTRPFIPGYNISDKKEGMVNWETVNLWMGESKNYWLSTTRSDYKPHARPIWGIWLDDFFYFGGGSETKTVKNLQDSNHISVHTESGQNAVIIEGYVERFEDDDFHLRANISSDMVNTINNNHVSIASFFHRFISLICAGWVPYELASSWSCLYLSSGVSAVLPIPVGDSRVLLSVTAPLAMNCKVCLILPNSP